MDLVRIELVRMELVHIGLVRGAQKKSPALAGLLSATTDL